MIKTLTPSFVALALLTATALHAQTEQEPNNFPSEANALTYGTAMAGSIGPCNPTDGSVDYFTFTTSGQGLLKLQVSAGNDSPNNMNLIVQLQDHNGALIGGGTVSSGANGVVVDQTMLYPCAGIGDYYIRMDSPSPLACVGYTLTYDLLPLAYGADAEPNQDAASATPATAGTDTDGRIGFLYGDNRDIFALQAADRGVFQATVQAVTEGDASGTMTAYLRDTTGTALSTWSVGIGANGLPATTTLEATCVGPMGGYYLELYNPGVCGVSYRFNYTVAPAAFGNDPEPNQLFTQAVPVALGAEQQGRLRFHYDDSRDIFRLHVPDDGAVTVVFRAEHAGGAQGIIPVDLRDINGASVAYWEVAVGANGMPDTTIYTRLCLGAEQDYFLDLWDPSVCGVSYSFRYTLEAPLYGDDPEPNQDMDEATDIDLDAGPVDGRLRFYYDNEGDYFRILHPGGPLRVITSAENAGPPGTMVVYIYDGTGYPIVIHADVAVGGAGVPATDTTATSGPVAAGTYYITMFSSSMCGISYRIGCNDDDADGLCNGQDPCPLLAGLQPGDPCDDGDPATTDDTVTTECECLGIPLGVDAHTDIPGMRLSVFPNPAHAELFLSADDGLPVDAEMCDMLGQIVLTARQVRAINVVGLAPGSYILSILDKAGQPRNRVRFMKHGSPTQ